MTSSCPGDWPCNSPHTEVICGTGDSDHSALLARIPLEKMLLLLPGPDKPNLPPNSRLKRPVPASQLAAFKEAYSIHTGEQSAELTTELDMLL